MIYRPNSHNICPLFLAGVVQSGEMSPSDASAPGRRRTASESLSQDESPTRGSSVRSPIRCISPELANTIALNPGGRPKEVDSRNSLQKLALKLLCSMCGYVMDLCVYVCMFFHLFRSTCTATEKRLRKWMGGPSAPLRASVVRLYPKPLPSLSRHKPLTSTCVSSSRP